ncbi:MAG: hypothetical protein V1870_03175 [Candidatus Aenigmatarchaeota archaeon]
MSFDLLGDSVVAVKRKEIGTDYKRILNADERELLKRIDSYAQSLQPEQREVFKKIVRSAYLFGIDVNEYGSDFYSSSSFPNKLMK